MSQDNQDAIERLTRIERKLDDHREVESANGDAIRGLSTQVQGMSEQITQVQGMSEQMVTKKEFGKLDETPAGHPVRHLPTEAAVAHQRQHKGAERIKPCSAPSK